MTLAQIMHLKYVTFIGWQLYVHRKNTEYCCHFCFWRTFWPLT